MAISEKEYLILSDLAYDNLIKDKFGSNILSDMYFDKDGKLSAEGKTLLGINRYAGSELKVGFQGVLESEDYKEVMKKWKAIDSSLSYEGLGIDSGYYGVAFQNEAGEIVFANRGTEPVGEQKKKDLVITDGQIFSSYYPNQFEDAMKFYNQVKGLSIARGKMINVTGHSLGGGIAQYVATMGTTAPTAMRTFNGVGVASQTLVSANDFMGYEGGLVNTIKEIAPYSENIVKELWAGLDDDTKANFIGTSALITGGVINFVSKSKG